MYIETSHMLRIWNIEAIGYIKIKITEMIG